MPLILPESAEIAAHKAEQGRQVDRRVVGIEGLERDLKSIDPSLSLIVAKPGAEDVGLLPARWHVVKHIPDAPDEYWPLVGPNDSYREPGAWVLEELKAGDLWNPRVHRDKKEAKRKLREARVRAKRLEQEQRRDEFEHNFSAARRVRGEGGLQRRTDLKASKATLAHRQKLSEARASAPEKP